MMMGCKLDLEEWAKLDREPTAANRALEVTFLDDHLHYGGRIHEEVAEALVARLSSGSGIATGHGIYLRMFNEYATALETVGAWGWALRNRSDYKLFLDAFLAYPHDAPHSFFQAAESAKSLERLLRLPRRSEMLDVLEGGFPNSTREESGKGLDDLLRALKKQAQTYLTDDLIILSTHNKGKHGAPMYRTADLSPREFYVLAPELRPADPSQRYSPRKFRVDRAMIKTLRKAIEQTGETIRFIAAITRSLQRAGRLAG